MTLSKEEKRLALQIASDELHGFLKPQAHKIKQDKNFPQFLMSKCGVFVSLYVGKQLRGCIGTFSEEKPLHKNIRKMAHAAATQDSRFPSIRAEELDLLRIEISILSPRLAIEGPEEIEIGKHGIYLESGSNRGTLLPQVAVNQQWTVEEFLGNCAQNKAGLAWDGWKSARLFTYEAIIFDSGLED